ncbi:hypothetical protein ACVWY0_001633 [Arthrobacter sp. UYNi723]
MTTKFQSSSLSAASFSRLLELLFGTTSTVGGEK